MIFFKNTLYASLLVFLLFGCKKAPFSVEDVPDPKKTDGGYVSNPDQIITTQTSIEINSILSSLDREGKAQVAVVLLDSIGGQVPKDFAVALFNYWKIGSKEKDNGLLVLVIKNQHRVEFETGYGLEGDLTDIVCHRIEQEHMVPYFKAGDYDSALLEGVKAVADNLTGKDTTANASDENNTTDSIYQSHPNESVTTATADVRPEEAPSVWRAILVLFNSFFFLFIYTIITISLTYGDRKKGTPLKDSFILFRNKLYDNNTLTLIFLLAGPVVIMESFFLIYNDTDVPPYISIGAAYVTWCLFVHLYFMVILPVKVSKASLKNNHHQKHEVLAEAYKKIKLFSYMFPLPFLFLFRRWHQRRMIALRDTPYLCTCGKTMSKLDEFDDNKFLSAGEVLEEQLKSVDYDVWVCNSCQRHLVFEYEDFKSKILRCASCSKKTMELVNNKVITHATESSSGYGYKMYTCRNCKKNDQIKYVIPRLSSSSDSSSGSSSSSSSDGGSSWGGGSSGGGGSGSSW